MKKILLLLCLCSPALLSAATKVLIDAVPTGAAFGGVAPIQLPFKDARGQDPKKIEAGLNSAVNGILPTVTQQGFTYLCLLSAPGDNPISIHIAASNSDLKLSETDTVVLAVLYTGGHEATDRIEYSTGAPDEKKSHVSTSLKNISIPEGGSTAGWIYLNLPRIQAEAEKEKSPVVFLSASGTGRIAAVPIPGMKAPLRMPEQQSVLGATWYLTSDEAALRKNGVMGHQLTPDGEKARK